MVKFNSVQNSVEMCKTQKKHRAGRARCECSDIDSPDLSENGNTGKMQPDFVFLVEKNHASLCVESQLFSKVFGSLLFGNAMFITVDQVVDIRFFRLLVIAADF